MPPIVPNPFNPDTLAKTCGGYDPTKDIITSTETSKELTDAGWVCIGRQIASTAGNQVLYILQRDKVVEPEPVAAPVAPASEPVVASTTGAAELTPTSKPTEPTKPTVRTRRND